MNFKCLTPLPLSRRFHCPLQVITTARKILSDLCQQSSTTSILPDQIVHFHIIDVAYTIPQPPLIQPPVSLVMPIIKSKIQSPTRPVAVIFSQAWLTLSRSLDISNSTFSPSLVGHAVNVLTVRLWKFVQSVYFKKMLTSEEFWELFGKIFLG